MANMKPVFIPSEHNYCSAGDKTPANGDQLNEFAAVEANSSMNTLQHETNRNNDSGGSWHHIPIKRGSSAHDGQLPKKTKQAEISLQNSFKALENHIDIDDQITEPNMAQQKDSKPPPIFVPKITDIKTMVHSIESILSKEDHTFKCSNQDNIKLCPVTVDAYRKLVKLLTNLKVNFHTYQIKQERSYRVVLKNMHYSTDVNEIKCAIENSGFTVRNITNARNLKTKSPLSMFFIDLEPSARNKDIYSIQYLLNAKITFEPPHKKNEVVQCKQCQNYGHTKKYCWHPHRCVKCGRGHETASCTKSKEEPPKCVLCDGNHPANYKGCTVYKEIKNKSFPPLRQKLMAVTVQGSEEQDRTPRPVASPVSHPRTETRSQQGASTSHEPDAEEPAHYKTPTYAQIASSRGPGPNAYSLPPQVGYTGHDASKWRNPAFSMGLKTSTKGNALGPGPAYKVDKMTRYGNAYSPSAPFGQRTGLSGKSVGPGPGAYNPDTKNIGKINHVGGTFGLRPDDLAKSIGPGPNAYNVKDPTLKRQPAFAMGTRNDMAHKHVGPGPNAYNPKRQDNVPTVKFGPPPGKTSAKDTGPGPGAYQGEKYLKYNKKANPPKFAFGVKTANSPYITPEDNAVCELICRK